MTDTTSLSKADTMALWHAVDAFNYMVREMPTLVFEDGTKLTQEVIDHEREQLKAAKRALRKVYAIRKAQTAPTPGAAP